MGNVSLCCQPEVVLLLVLRQAAHLIMFCYEAPPLLYQPQPLAQLMLAGYNAFKAKTMWNMVMVVFLTTTFSQEQVFRYCY